MVCIVLFLSRAVGFCSLVLVLVVPSMWAFVHCSSGDFCSGCCHLPMFFRGGAVRFSFFVFRFSFFECALWVDFLTWPDI